MKYLPNQIIEPFWVRSSYFVVGNCRRRHLVIVAGRYRAINPRIVSLVRTLGLMTYPLYLVHDELGHWFIGTLISTGINKWLALSIGAMAIIGLSWLICTLWEPQIRVILGTIFDQMNTMVVKGLQKSKMTASKPD